MSIFTVLFTKLKLHVCEKQMKINSSFLCHELIKRTAGYFARVMDGGNDNDFCRQNLMLEKVVVKSRCANDFV